MGNRKVIAALGLAVCLLALVAAGCGGGGGSPGVANLNGSTDSSTNSSPDGGSSLNSSGGPPSGSAGNFALAMNLPGQSGVKFAACMRRHGVPNFPDPNGQGQVSIKSGSGIDPRSPKFKAAQQTCQKLLPNGGEQSPAQQAQQLRQATAFAECMRKHGVSNFPDPSSSGGIQISPNSGSGLDPNSPTFQNAQKACASKLGRGGAPVTSSNG
jgi:hypothetical protein